ncbi:auxin response factor 16-like isoform X2 [Cornus florida]|uniref:auxin response factor 16-like isoform X2 n=1 Tax=Cornus florida TaxID=4283 RepID=UPI00289AFD5E|nr:auxin response factor 16-like isoform X2 [Cornus florida]
MGLTAQSRNSGMRRSSGGLVNWRRHDPWREGDRRRKRVLTVEESVVVVVAAPPFSLSSISAAYCGFGDSGGGGTAVVVRWEWWWQLQRWEGGTVEARCLSLLLISAADCGFGDSGGGDVGVVGMWWRGGGVRWECYKVLSNQSTESCSSFRLKRDGSLHGSSHHACAGPTRVALPPVGSNVIYFPQGHAEHACEMVDFTKSPKVPPMICCKVLDVRLVADYETEEVCARICLLKLNSNKADFDFQYEAIPDTPIFAKCLTHSDLTSSTFSVPHTCTNVFKHSVDSQTIIVKDVQGKEWDLMSGWANFVGTKGLVTGDAIVFLRATNGNISVGIVKRGLRRVKAESVIEAMTLASNGEPFLVQYFPRALTPEFCVEASIFEAAKSIIWWVGCRIQMEFESEDASGTHWFNATVSSVGDFDPICWPASAWRTPQVIWDEDHCGLLQNVNAWLVTVAEDMLLVNLSPSLIPKPPTDASPAPAFCSLTMQVSKSDHDGKADEECAYASPATLQQLEQANSGVHIESQARPPIRLTYRRRSKE